jgi:hypothetical protein
MLWRWLGSTAGRIVNADEKDRRSGMGAGQVYRDHERPPVCGVFVLRRVNAHKKNPSVQAVKRTEGRELGRKKRITVTGQSAPEVLNGRLTTDFLPPLRQYRL